MEIRKKSITIAAFDFDGTLTYCDTLIPFLLHSVGKIKGFYYLLNLIPAFTGYLFGKTSRVELKEKILTKFIRGFSFRCLRAKGKGFVNSLHSLVRPAAMDRLRWHQQQGHRCLLISANLDIYLIPWAEFVGFGNTLSTSLEFDQEGQATGKLAGENCRGPEKVRRLEQLLGPKENYILYAYGDSDGDRELLAYADHPYFRTFPNESTKTTNNH